ncbi:MAG: bifunctional precorrin-2 dehydrogenase/sirohydrochlorin ferrochelatase [Synergistaceae bacterium]|nr:bifunctional precorrin-2 dehydrogenase/sirohydrochlorin ferrochelatase [Synergistaceae bacterium]
MPEHSRPPFFPMMMDLQAKKILIIGGGHIASRRARTLITCGAKLVAISPVFSENFPDEAHKIFREFQPEDISENFTFVIAATNKREVNSLVHDLANAKNIPVNVADCQDECDFFFPSLINFENVSVSVNSAGISSKLTHKLSERLREVWPKWVKLEREKI